jgi:hypothetical protein
VKTFSPFAGMTLDIGPARYQFVASPHFQDEQEVFAVEGGEALVYQLRNVVSDTLHALKVMKPVYRTDRYVRVAHVFANFKDMPGFALADRLCLTKSDHSRLIADFPDLEYATLMPWLPGKTWAGLLVDRKASARYTLEKARRLATLTADLLWHFESHNLAHTDIAGGNVMLASNLQGVDVLDVEGMYMPGIAPPHWNSQGTPGYQHRHLDKRGQWRPEGDRFAGAMLLTEMLTWWNPLVRAHTPDDADALFSPGELQTVGFPRWQAVRDTLWTVNPELLHLFDNAWASPDLDRCPDLTTWAMCLVAPS